MTDRPLILWFRRDLRLADNPMLAAAVATGRLAPPSQVVPAVVPIQLPPLRERPEDIPELVEHFFTKSKEKHNRSDLALPDSLQRLFSAYRWPGNVRELENIIERAISFANTPEILPVDLPEFLRYTPAKPKNRPAALRLKEALSTFEKETISNALIENSGNISRAASALGIYRQQLQRKIKQYKIAT